MSASSTSSTESNSTKNSSTEAVYSPSQDGDSARTSGEYENSGLSGHESDEASSLASLSDLDDDGDDELRQLTNDIATAQLLVSRKLNALIIAKQSQLDDSF